MKIQPLTRDQAVVSTVASLGFDPESVDLTVPEVVAAAVRRTASFTCPATPRRLAALTRQAALGLVDDANDEDDFPVRAIVETLTAYGDLIEAPVRTEGGSEQRLLFLAAPSFVEVGSVMLLTGIRAEGVPFLSGSVAGLVECDGHVRRLAPDHGLGVAELTELGLRAVSAAHWIGAPLLTSSEELVADYDRRLDSTGLSGTIDDCLILDSTQPVTYYRGRWRAVSSKDSGRFVARRPTAYGAPLWCYLQIDAGVVVQVLDLPVQDRLNRACDEAWRLQAAIDATRGSPQTLRVGAGRRSDLAVLHLLSPPPAWAQRRLDTIGRPIPRDRSLLSYAVEESHIEAELEFLREMLWTVRLQDGDRE